MAHSYEEAKKEANKIIIWLGIITIIEVAVALFLKGHLTETEMPSWVGGLNGILMIIGSAVKAYLIIYFFMHMKYEVPTMVKTVLMPTLLLVWAVIAFASEGSYWKNGRQKVRNNVAKVEKVDKK
ncbi:MAG: hypothetical protein RLZZ546_634 [Bacteroidota bacterium]|jgi:cytochrome c oxidase subunit IV